jgi:hypothetical protein
MLTAERAEEEDGYDLYSPAISLDEGKCQTTHNKGDRPVRGLSLPHPLGIVGDLKCRDVRHFGHSRSDSFDA